MSTLMTTVSQILRQEIDQGIPDSLPELDPAFKQIARSSVGVERNGIGRDWKKLQVFSGSLAGAHSWRSALGPAPSLDGADAAATSGPSLFGAGTLRTWQSVDNIASPGFVTRTISLVQGYGNFHVPLDLMRSDKLDASVGSMVAQIGKGAAKRQALSQVHAFWKLGQIGSQVSSNNAIAVVIPYSGSSVTVTNSTPVEVKLTNGRIRSFFPGLILDFYLSSDGSLLGFSTTNAIAIVMRVNYLKKTIWVRRVSGGADFNITAADPVIVMPADNGASATNNDITAASKTFSPSGLTDWIKAADGAGANSVYGIVLDRYPQFSSIVDTSLSGALTSDILNKYIGGFSDAYGSELDTILTTPGVILGFLENLDSGAQLLRYDTQGEALAVEAGFMPFGYVHDGKKYRIMTSPNCPTGIVYVLKFGDKNIQKLVPPKLDGTRADGRFESEVEFVAPVFGGNGIFMPAYTSTAQLADAVIAPYINIMEFVPKMVQGIKIGTFAENIYTQS